VAHVVVWVDIQVGVHVSLVCSPYGTSHTWPWLFESQYPLNIVSVDFLARNRVDDGRFDTKKWEGGTSGFRWSDTSQGCDDIGPSLSLPVCLDFGQ